MVQGIGRYALRSAAGALLALTLFPQPTQAIIGGSLVNVTEQQQRGLVTIINGTGFCSGVLLSSDWVMTAGHCVPTMRPNPSVIVEAAWAPGVSFASDAIYQFANAADRDNPGPEFALVHLSSSVTGIDPSYRMQLYSGGADSLVGKTLAKYGAGHSTLADANPATGGIVPPGGRGRYRAADMTVASVVRDELGFVPNQDGQITMPGDSGGPAIIWKEGTAFLAGITSNGAWDCFDYTNSSACRSTMFQVKLANDVSIPRIKAAAEAVLRSSWDPRATSVAVGIYLPEIALTDFPIQDVNTAHWAQAARLANDLCYNRGFSAGHFDGHQHLVDAEVDRIFGIQCSGAGTVWRDAGMDEVHATGWGFDDINQVTWAQANRAAERLCANAGQGFAGGHFTGHQIGTRVGLVCYLDGAQWFDALDAEIAATGWGFGDPFLDNNIWAQAGRAATDFCRGKGFSGGFMNGHNVPGRFGVVCQR